MWWFKRPGETLVLGDVSNQISKPNGTSIRFVDPKTIYSLHTMTLLANQIREFSISKINSSSLSSVRMKWHKTAMSGCVLMFETHFWSQNWHQSCVILAQLQPCVHLSIFEKVVEWLVALQYWNWFMFGMIYRRTGNYWISRVLNHHNLIVSSQLVDSIRTTITTDDRLYLLDLNRAFKVSFGPQTDHLQPRVLLKPLALRSKRLND